jgi:hypothetical protein
LDSVRFLQRHEGLETLFWDEDFFDAVYRRAYEFFVPEVAVVNVFWEFFPKRGDEGLVVFGGVEFFCAEKLPVPELPGALQHLHVEESLVFGWDVLEERENCAFRMLVAKRVEDEAFYGYEGVSVCRNPVGWFRFDAPRYVLS